MAVTFTESRIVSASAGLTTWHFAWTSDQEDPTYYLYQDGQLIAVTQQAWRYVVVASSERFLFEVLDDAEATPTVGYPGRVNVTWTSVEGAYGYSVQEYVDGGWPQRQKIKDNGEAWFSFQSRYLEDVTTHQFRVVPEFGEGIEGRPLNFTVLMVRRPDGPDLTYTYDDETHKVTIAAA